MKVRLSCTAFYLNNIKGLFLILFLIFLCGNMYSQNAVVYGQILGDKNKPLEFASIKLLDLAVGTRTDNKGNYELTVPANKDITVVISYFNYLEQKFNLNLKENQRYNINTSLKINVVKIPEVSITDKQDAQISFTKLDPKTISSIPSATGGVEAIIKTMPGVASNNELSSQYSVRGGNYDENLVYVNDIEIYRPLLVRAGQQEGLSFVNSDMVSSIQFSAGGFDAKYGDKMSSVLDIQYKKPKEFSGSVSASLLGYTAEVEGVIKDKWTYMVGYRQKSNSYVLKSLDTQGDYKPSFTDVQSIITYEPDNKWEFSFLGNYANNKYDFIPQTQETEFGTLNQALKLKIYFDGQEVDKFNTYMGAISATYKKTDKLKLKFIASAFRSNEQEAFDIQGEYYLSTLETDYSKSTFGKEVQNMGVGAFLNHARNYLTADVFSLEHKGYYFGNKNNLIWGVKLQEEHITDKLNEWKMIDSAGYSLPYITDSIGFTNPVVQPYYNLNMQDYVNTNINLITYKSSCFIQDNLNFEGVNSTKTISAGIRAIYNNLNNELDLSPRIIFSLKPHWEKLITFKAATGIYYQPPFYRELRDFDGTINKNQESQKSIHFVLGSDYDFKAWNRPFKFTSEIYYKKLESLIPYIVDNVRIRYYAYEKSHGYSTGVDFKINGEFVKGIESWASLTIMKTMEDVEGDYFYKFYNKEKELIIPGYTADKVATDSVKIQPGYIPRPTDQRINFSLFFQDYLPKHPTYKMHLNLVFGSELPFGAPASPKYADTLRMPYYFRVDIGFSKQILGENIKLSQKKCFKFIKSLWASMEVFNLLDRRNTLSYTWIMDVTGRQYAIPNYLTSRQLNVRLIAKF
ncbi:MAG: carboxypeptidase-like regulatory domain-containing protein [Bacteroidota bacterium]|nr:carboxypeptidase-like regulatory domain-containing protein [Bacteroidota bacterium]